MPCSSHAHRNDNNYSLYGNSIFARGLRVVYSRIYHLLSVIQCPCWCLPHQRLHHFLCERNEQRLLSRWVVHHAFELGAILFHLGFWKHGQEGFAGSNTGKETSKQNRRARLRHGRAAPRSGVYDGGDCGSAGYRHGNFECKWKGISYYNSRKFYGVEKK
jgi:hypothetical protein